MSQMLNAARWRLLPAVFVAAMTLAGCGLFDSADPIAAVTSAASSQLGVTPTVHAAIATPGGTMVIYTAQKQGNCYLGEMFAEQRGGRWFASSGGYGGGPCPGQSGAASEAYSVSGGSGSTPDFQWSLASGEIYDPAIVRLEVEWDDGVSSPADITNGIYYAFRQGTTAQVTSVKAYDSSDQLVPQEP